MVGMQSTRAFELDDAADCSFRAYMEHWPVEHALYRKPRMCKSLLRNAACEPWKASKQPRRNTP